RSRAVRLEAWASLEDVVRRTGCAGAPADARSGSGGRAGRGSTRPRIGRQDGPTDREAPMGVLVLANDFRDADGAARRLQQRPAHIDGVRRMKAEGTFLEGGAMLDDDGRMVGSMLVVDFPSRAEVDAWLASDPYVTGQVWEHITVRRFRRVQL